MRQRIYLETTVWYQMVNYSDSEFKDNARQLFQLIERNRFEIFISSIVMEEVALNAPKYRSKLEDLIGRYAPAVLVPSSEAEDISSAYVENAFKNRVRNEVIVDAHHAAIATIANISYIASYNYRNLLSVKALENFNAVNLLAGYNHFLSIVPPFMFLDLQDYNGEKGAIDEKVWKLKKRLGRTLENRLKTEPSKRTKHYTEQAKKMEKKFGLQAVSFRNNY